MAENKTTLSTNNFVAVCLVGVILVIVISWLIGRGLYNQLAFQNRVITKQSAANNQLQKNLEALPALQANYAALGKSLQLINDALPSEADFPAIVGASETMAGVSGVVLKTVSPESTVSAETDTTPVTATGPQTTGFSTVVEGSYDNILKYLATVEISARPMKITALTLSGVTTTQEAKVSLVTYYQGAADLKPKYETVGK